MRVNEQYQRAVFDILDTDGSGHIEVIIKILYMLRLYYNVVVFTDFQTHFIFFQIKSMRDINLVSSD